jgi:protein-disulfide isomerase
MAADAGLTRFYRLLGAAAVVGGLVLLWLVWRPATISIPANVTVTAADTAGFHGYPLGPEEAPVEIVEYADYQCPACQDFEMVQFPDVKKQLINTGRVRWVYRDYPLDRPHPFARLAAHSAACADDQGRYWPQHASIYAGQPDWSVERDASGTLRDYAQRNGLDLAKYDECMQSARHAGRIQASYDEGSRLGVGSTPTFLIGGRLYPGRQSSDELRRLVDSLAPVAAPAQ